MEPLEICVAGTRQMNNHTETRTDERCDCEAIVKWSRFNETMQFDARIVNFSRSGIYLETYQAIKLGTTILVKLEILLSGAWGSSDHGWLRTISMGEVKWCKELIRNDAELYGIGIRYYDAE
jgi:hypothetical protein